MYRNAYYLTDVSKQWLAFPFSPSRAGLLNYPSINSSPNLHICTISFPYHIPKYEFNQIMHTDRAFNVYSKLHILLFLYMLAKRELVRKGVCQLLRYPGRKSEAFRRQLISQTKHMNSTSDGYQETHQRSP